jgi:hypothetical protein
MKYIKSWEIFESESTAYDKMCDAEWEDFIKFIRWIPKRDEVDEWFSNHIESDYEMWKNGDYDDDDEETKESWSKPCYWWENLGMEIHDGAYTDDPDDGDIATEENWNSYLAYLMTIWEMKGNSSFESQADEIISRYVMRNLENPGKWVGIFSYGGFNPSLNKDFINKAINRGIETNPDVIETLAPVFKEDWFVPTDFSKSIYSAFERGM